MNSADKKLIVLDIDNTLIYGCHHEIAGLDYGVYSIDKDVYRIYKRPYVDQFLDYCFKTFKVGIWSSACMEHIENVIDHLKIDKSKLEFIYDAKKCTQRRTEHYNNYLIVKKFHKLKKKGYDLSQIIGIDDNRWAYELNRGNLVRVSCWEGTNDRSDREWLLNDQELLLLIDYLETIKDVPDIRNIWKEHWKKILK